MGDSWILPLAKDCNQLVRWTQFSAVQGGKWTAKVAHSLGRHLLMRHLLGLDFLASETAFSRPRPWLRSAPAVKPWLDPFHILPCDYSHGQDVNTELPSNPELNADQDSKNLPNSREKWLCLVIAALCSNRKNYNKIRTTLTQIQNIKNKENLKLVNKSQK